MRRHIAFAAVAAILSATLFPATATAADTTSAASTTAAPAAAGCAPLRACIPQTVVLDGARLALTRLLVRAGVPALRQELSTLRAKADTYLTQGPWSVTDKPQLPPSGDKLTIDKSDYDAFERALGQIQAAYSTEDLAGLRAQVTPEMLSYFSEQLAGNSSRGLINRVTDVKLLRGDLAEAWREGHTDYATVAMNFALKDSMVERASGQTVEGGERSEATELWTFMRARGGNWLLSAIQQT